MPQASAIAAETIVEDIACLTGGKVIAQKKSACRLKSDAG
jgi:hypothetical protein